MGKKCLTTFIVLMFLASLAMVGVAVQASPILPWEGTITLHATVTTNPFWGYYGGYHHIWQAIKTEFEKIGINLVIDYYDDSVWWDRVWGQGWNHTGDTPYPPGGWDLTCIEWWMMPTGLIRLESLAYSWLTPPTGSNIFPYMNDKSDDLLWKGMHTLDAETRQYYLRKWQELFMHDPSMINLYYPRVYEVTGAWVEGWDPVVRFRDISHLSLNFGKMPAERQKLHTDWVYHAVSEDVWSLLPLFMKTSTEQWMCDLQFETLYDLSIDPWSPTGQEPPPSDFYSKPALAAAPPIFMDGPYGLNTRARVPLRENVHWSDGVLFNATDVKLTFDSILDLTSGATAHGDIEHVIESVEITNETCIDFILYEPYADLATLLSNDWGLAIMPYHIFKDIAPAQIKNHPSNTAFDDPSKWAPVTGPFKLKEIVPGEFALLEKNPLYFGYDLGWGPDWSIQAIYLKWVPDPAVRLLEFQTYRLDGGVYATAPLEVWKEIETDPNLNVFQYDRPASNLVLLNFNNPYLSNRYLRLAIAHAIPYERIFAEILPSWGIETAYPGKTLITPLHYYTDPDNVTVHLFNEELEPYHYDIEEALDYMEMWWYSTNQPYTDGPVGDSDLSGLVDLDDFLIWRENFGTTPADWIFLPGRDIDPDFNNDLIVDVLNDFPLWADNYGKKYPTAGASALNENTIRVSANVSSYIAVIPENTVDPTLTPDKNYTVSIYTDYTVNDIWAWQFSLTYNPNILHGIEVTNGDLITKEKYPGADFIPGTFDNEAGKLSLTGAYFFYISKPTPMTSGPEILANVTFTVVGVGTSNISMGLETGLGGVTEDPELGPGYGGTYIIIDAETMPDHIGHGYFDNTAPPPAFTATIDMPACLNLKSKGKWITAPIELPESYNVEDIDVSTVLLNDEVPAESSKVSRKKLIVKFGRSKVLALLPQSGEVELTVTGKLFDGTRFEGSDTIRVIGQ